MMTTHNLFVGIWTTDEVNDTDYPRPGKLYDTFVQWVQYPFRAHDRGGDPLVIQDEAELAAWADENFNSWDIWGMADPNAGEEAE